MSARTFWVIVEGQNFAVSILDTQDLSTIRGGSLLLRDLVFEAGNWLATRFEGCVTQATIGGSLGIWRIKGGGAGAVTKALRDLRAHFSQGNWQHIAFGLGAVEDDGQGYLRQRSRLRAAMQRQRLAQSRLPYPDRTTAGLGVCPVDFVRPVSRTSKMRIGGGERVPISESVWARRSHGIAAKQSLIREETQRAEEALSPAALTLLKRDDRPFAMQIPSISEAAAAPEALKRSLHDKICVISMDGNGFGKIQDKMLAAKDDLSEQVRFDDGLADLRAQLVGRIFSTVIDQGGVGMPCEAELALREDSDGAGSDEVARFELLLWGGDEIMFIVPARLGWKVMEEIGTFAETASLWDHPVSFAVGAVFCHHDAPIARIKRLADDLASYLKSLEKEGDEGRNGRDETLFLVKVLESFDHVGMNLAKHFEAHLPTPTKEARPGEAGRRAFRAMDLEQIRGLRNAAEEIARGRGNRLSRGRLRKTALGLHQGAVPGASYRGDKWEDFVGESADLLQGSAGKAAMSKLGRDRLFVLLEEYWDYLTPIEQPNQVGERLA